MNILQAIKAVAPLCREPDAWALALSPLFEKNSMTSPREIAYFLGEFAYESDQFCRLSENLNYTSPNRLVSIFPSHFKDVEEAKQYAGQPEKIANRVYANRMGNGEEASGDGWKFRGRGLPQLTGRDNYTEASKDLGIDIVANPDFLLSIAGAALIGVWFWKKHNLSQWALAHNPQKVTEIITGCEIGYEARLSLIEKALAVLG